MGYSKKLFAPRIGFAYQLTNSTVIRSGYGTTYHSHPWGAQALRGWYPLTIVAVFSGTNGYQPITTSPSYVEAGVPNEPLGSDVGILPICCPDISQGRLPLPEVSEMGYPVANRELRRGYIQSWNFIIEQKLPGQFVTSVGYVGTASVNGFAFLDINASQIPGSGDDGRPLFAQFGRTAATREWAGRDVQMESFFECRRTGSRPKADVRVGLANSTAVILSNLAMDQEPVRQRTAEIGLRIALGAEPCGIFRLVIGQGLSLSAAGIAIGFVTAAGLTRVMKSMLVGITATDPGTFALGAAI